MAAELGLHQDAPQMCLRCASDARLTPNPGDCKRPVLKRRREHRRRRQDTDHRPWSSTTCSGREWRHNARGRSAGGGAHCRQLQSAPECVQQTRECWSFRTPVQGPRLPGPRPTAHRPGLRAHGPRSAPTLGPVTSRISPEF